jgi:hypothetical protein
MKQTSTRNVHAPVRTVWRWNVRLSFLYRILVVQTICWISYLSSQTLQEPEFPRALEVAQSLPPAAFKHQQRITTKQSMSDSTETDDNSVNAMSHAVEAHIRKDVTVEKSLASSNIPIFYNLFVGAESDASRVDQLVSQQMATMNPKIHFPVFVNSIGYRINIPNTTMLGHYENGTEMITLRSLWTHCKENPLDRVVYLHSKGSYTDTFENGLLRRFLTTGALSRHCANLPETCNVCSSRFSPLPHPHTSGNMWLARCEYVRYLMDPFEFSDRMDEFNTEGSNNGRGNDQAACDGRLRYSAENWIASHPSVKPCDLYPNPKFKWGYLGLPRTRTFDVALAPAPRFRAMEYVMWPECAGRGLDLQQRLLEYQGLYHQRPDDSWWGWRFFEQIDGSRKRLPYYQLYWKHLSRNLEHVASAELGYNEELWDALRHPPLLAGKSWESLDDTHRSGLEKLGYEAKSWNATLFLSPAVDNVDEGGMQNITAYNCPGGSRLAQGPGIDDKRDDKFSTALRDVTTGSVNKRKGRNKRLLVLATVPKSTRHVIAAWSQLECFSSGVDHVVISAPKWSKDTVDKIANMARSNIPRFANGQVELSVQHHLNNRYDVGLWCDALEATDIERYDEFGLINDSVFALREFTGVFDALRAKNVSLTSMSYSYTPKWLIGPSGPENFWVESVFRGFDKAGIAAFQDHSCVAEDHPFFCPGEENNKACIINNFEHDLVTSYPCDSVYGLYPSDTPKQHLEKNRFRTWVKNPEYWRDLVEKLDFPVSKVKETTMVKSVTDPALTKCTQYYNHSLLYDFDFTLAKPYHQRGWYALDKSLQRIARFVLGMADKDSWKDWTTSKYGSKSYHELTSEQQFTVSQVFECSATAWNSNDCGPQKKKEGKRKKMERNNIESTSSLAKYKKKNLSLLMSSIMGTTSKVKKKFIDRFRFA